MIAKIKVKNKNEANNGASVVEFAIILPLLFIFVFAIIEFGVLLYDKAVLNDSIRNNSRNAILYTPNELTDSEFRTLIYNNIKNDLENRLISFKNSLFDFNKDSNEHITWKNKEGEEISWDDINRGDGSVLVLNIPYSFKFLIFSTLLGGPDGIPLTAKAVMRVE